jgi:hypothetical protein
MLSASLEVCRKHIAQGLITPEVVPQVANKLYFFAKQCYVRRHPDGRGALDLALKHDRKPRTRLLWLFSKLRIRPEWYDSLARTGKRVCECTGLRKARL